MTINSSPVYCANHPGVETTLRCNKCGKPICAKCAVRTPTGYRCKECVRGQMRIFDTATGVDYLLAFLVGGFLSAIASVLVGVISGVGGIFSWFIIIAAAPTAGVIIAEAVRFVTRRHRSKSLFITAAVAVVLGILPALLVHIITFNLFSLIFQIIYLVVATPVFYARLSGIQIAK
jgi:hypothetical protein